MNLKNAKLLGVTFGIVLFIVLALSFTYAYVTWTSPKINKNVISKCFNVLYTKGSDITGTLMPSDTYKGGLSTIIKMNMDSSCDIDGEGIIKLNTESTTSSNLYREGLLNYAIEKDNKLIKEGSITSSGIKEISVGKLDRKTSATTSYKLFVWVDNKLVNNNDVDLTFSGNISAEVRQYMPSKIGQHITDLYNNSIKETITNNNIEYEYATDVSLMKDRFGSNTNTKTTGNIRYYGANPDNYIQLGEDKVNDLYRIIGLFKEIELSDGRKKDLIKIVKNDSIGDYLWDTSESNINSGKGINQWGPSTDKNGNSYEGSDLMRLLNPGYNGINGSLWWNGTSGKCYNNKRNEFNNCDFKLNSLNPNIINKIENVIWHMGGESSSKIFSNNAYIMERKDGKISNPMDGINRTSIWTGKVALISSSDYGYAVDFKACQNNLFNFNSTECSSNNWMKINTNQWLLAPISTDEYDVWVVTKSGFVDYYYESYRMYSVRPTFFIDSELILLSGDGKKLTPFKIKI